MPLYHGRHRQVFYSSRLISSSLGKLAGEGEKLEQFILEYRKLKNER